MNKSKARLVYLAADHRGFFLKEKIKKWLVKKGEAVKDLSEKYQPGDDYPDAAASAAAAIKKKGWAILFCGSGVGISIAANRFSWVRCGLGLNGKQIKRAREEDDINCLALAADFTATGKAKKMAQVFLATPFRRRARYQRRIRKLSVLTKKNES